MHRLIDLKHYCPVLLVLSFLGGCSATPSRPQTIGFGFSKPAEVVQKAAVDALVVSGFEIQKSEPLYVEGSRPHRFGMVVGSGGETVGVWLKVINNDKTEVLVATAMSVLGMAGQQSWNDVILREMEKTLGPREQ